MNRQFIKWCVLLGAIAALGSGCSPAEQIPRRYYGNPYPQPRTVALALFSNMSGVEQLDVLAATEEFYSELQQIPDINVIPIDRMLRALHVLGMNGINSPQDAMELAQQLDADIVITGSITQYDPYNPPRVAMVVQLYDRDSRLIAAQPDQQPIDPVTLARQPSTFVMNSASHNESTTTVARVFDCDQEDIIARVKQYAQNRSGTDSPAGWQHYIRSQTYLAFVSHELIGEILAIEKQRVQDIQMRSLAASQNDIHVNERGEI